MAGKYLICEGADSVAIFESEEVEKAWAILFADKERTFSVVQISPAVRVALGEKLGMHSGDKVEYKRQDQCAQQGMVYAEMIDLAAEFHEFFR